MCQTGKIGEGGAAIRIETGCEHMGHPAENGVAPVDGSGAAMVEEHDTPGAHMVFPQPERVGGEITRGNREAVETSEDGAYAGESIFDGGERLLEEEGEGGGVVGGQGAGDALGGPAEPGEGGEDGVGGGEDVVGVFEGDDAEDDGEDEDVGVAGDEAELAGEEVAVCGDEGEDEVLELDGEGGPQGHCEQTDRGQTKPSQIAHHRTARSGPVSHTGLPFCSCQLAHYRWFHYSTYCFPFPQAESMCPALCSYPISDDLPIVLRLRRNRTFRGSTGTGGFAFQRPICAT
jgi:hypothetical protein